MPIEIYAILKAVNIVMERMRFLAVPGIIHRKNAKGDEFEAIGFYDLPFFIYRDIREARFCYVLAQDLGATYQDLDVRHTVKDVTCAMIQRFMENQTI